MHPEIDKIYKVHIVLVFLSPLQHPAPRGGPALRPERRSGLDRSFLTPLLHQKAVSIAFQAHQEAEEIFSTAGGGRKEVGDSNPSNLTRQQIPEMGAIGGPNRKTNILRGTEVGVFIPPPLCLSQFLQM